jgi:hypothetical protein
MGKYQMFTSIYCCLFLHELVKTSVNSHAYIFCVNDNCAYLACFHFVESRLGANGVAVGIVD